MDIVIERLKFMDRYSILDVRNLGLTELPDVPGYDRVKHFYCTGNKLTWLPELPNVESLFCSQNQLTELPELPVVKYLTCSQNKLTRLPKLPKIISLLCQDNKLVELTTPGEKLSAWEINCSRNNLTWLPELSKAYRVDCSHNRLMYLPRSISPMMGTEIICHNNQMRFSPERTIIFWGLYRYYLAAIYVRRWRRNAMKRSAVRKTDLHIELLYSPDLPFYLDRVETLDRFKK
jgi:Leucine-rich repeat (LRR) protein